MKLNLSVDEALSTTRAVRKRLDLERRVPRELIEECLDLALQAPNGSNRNMWHWIIIDDPELIAKVGGMYKAMLEEGRKAGGASYSTGVPREDKLLESSMSFADTIDKVPAILIPLMQGRPEGKSLIFQANMWGSILQAVWSFFLALRERGLGAAWMTQPLMHEREIAEMLGIPIDRYTQVGFFPIAYTKGVDFRRAWRKPVSEVLSYNRFEQPASTEANF